MKTTNSYELELIREVVEKNTCGGVAISCPRIEYPDIGYIRCPLCPKYKDPVKARGNCSHFRAYARAREWLHKYGYD